jgi:uncharacterized membrane protein YidH (DUF202 family)
VSPRQAQPEKGVALLTFSSGFTGEEDADSLVATAGLPLPEPRRKDAYRTSANFYIFGEAMAEEKEQNSLQVMQQLVELAKVRTRQSAERSYMNAERTLSVWVRTSLAAMIFGIAIDRLGLMAKSNTRFIFHHNTPSMVTGAGLVAFAMLMALSAAIRFILYARAYRKEYAFPARHNGSLPTIYSFMIVVFGALLLSLMFALR